MELKKTLVSEAMATHCIGRHHVNLPDSYVASPITMGAFKVLPNISNQLSIDVLIRHENFSVEGFLREVSKRRAELKNMEDGTTNVLQLDRALTEHANIFRVQEIDDAYVSELIFLRGSSMVTLRLESYQDTFVEAEQKLIEFSKRTKVRSTTGAMTSSEGFCLGPIYVEGEFVQERADFLFKNGANAKFQINVDTFSPDERISLLDRMSGPNSLLKAFNVNHTVLRAGERAVAGMRAQEWLGWARLQGEHEFKSLKFTLETLRPDPGKAKPSIALTFDMESSVRESSNTFVISDDEAIKNWDLVVNSIR